MSSYLPLTYTPGNGAQVPFQSNAAVASVNLFGANVWQVGGAYGTQFSLTYTAWTGVQTVSTTVSLPFPSFTLPTGAQAFLQASVTIANATQPAVVYGIPEILLTTTGGAYRSSTGGVASFVFKTGRPYNTFSLKVLVSAYAPSSQPQQVTSFNLQVLLLGQPGSS